MAIPPDSELAVGGNLQRAVATHYDPRSSFSVAYHPRWPGVKLMTRGRCVALEAVVLDEDAWRPATEALTAARVAEAALRAGYALYDGRELYFWATGERVFCVDEKVPGAVSFTYARGQWRRNRPLSREELRAKRLARLGEKTAAPPRDDRCAVDGCDRTSRAPRGLCAEHRRDATGELLALDDANVAAGPAERRLGELRVAAARGQHPEAAADFLRVLSSGAGFLVHPGSRSGVGKGESVTFAVATLGATKWAWWKDEALSKHDSGRETLVVRSVGLDDAGTYVCRALVGGAWLRSEPARLLLDPDVEKRERRKQFLQVATADEATCVEALRLDPDDDRFAGAVLARLAALAWGRGDRVKALYYASDAAVRGSPDVCGVHAKAAASLGFFDEALGALDGARRLRRTEKWHAPFREDVLRRMRDKETTAVPPSPQNHPPPKQEKQQRANGECHQKALDALGLTRLPARADLRKRYFELARQHHPDKGGDHAAFLVIQAAYERLHQQLAA